METPTPEPKAQRYPDEFYGKPNIDNTVVIGICSACNDPIYMGDGMRATDEEGNVLLWHWYPHNGRECWILV